MVDFMRICQHPECNNKIDKKQNEKYCSQSCSNSMTSKVYTEEERPPLFCLECGDRLGKEREQQAYSKGREDSPICSRKCWKKSLREERVCEYEHCDNEFSVPKSSPKRFCGTKCVKYWQTDRDKHCKSDKDKLKKECSICGEIFITKRYNGEKHGRCKRCKGKSPKRVGSHVLTKEEYTRVMGRFRSRMSAKNMTNSYMKDLISQCKYSPKRENITKPLIKTKRQHLKIKREIKRQK